MDALAQALLTLLHEQGDISVAKAAKKLNASQSELRTLITWLGHSPILGGLELVELVKEADLERLRLTPLGRRSAAAQPGNLPVRALRRSAQEQRLATELLAEEVPVALSYNGLSYAVMMASPADLEDFALGFSLTESLITQAHELLDCEVVAQPAGITLELRIPEERFHQLKERRRTLTGRTGCGICGKESLEQAITMPPKVENTLSVSAANIAQGFARLEQAQTLNQATGAVHAAGLFAENQLLLREDVGRHNALDKLIGAQARNPLPPGIALITSRASYEMVAKAAAANFQVLAAISAPTALAVELAEAAGITLIGFARGDRMTVFTHSERLRP